MTRLLTALLLSSALVACSAPDASEPDAAADAATTPETESTQTVVAVQMSPANDTPSLRQYWQLDGFDAPESVIEAGNEILYVSNVGGDGSAQDNNGVISKIGMNGTMIDRNWVTATETRVLNGPKGMALIPNDLGTETLVVADIDHIVLIDVDSAEIVKRIPADGAGFLNDVARGQGQTALISDSANARIYMVENDVVTIWLEDERLGGVNGLHNDGDRLLVTTMSGGELLSIDWETKAITGIASGMENADGIGIRPDGSYIISSWPGQLWHVREGEAPTLIQDTSGDTPILMNDILLSGYRLVTPNWMPGTVRGYGVE